LLPSKEKLKKGITLFAETFKKYSDQRVRIEESMTQYRWIIERCPLCWGRQSDRPACHLAVGVLQEALYWVSGGKLYSVEETRCIGVGDASCTIEIDKQPFQ
jgi:predicted hydrocarbon binding protein